MKRAALLVAAAVLSGCAGTLDRLETATGPDAYWINNVPPDVEKLEAERQRTAFYNQPAMKIYLTAARALPVVIFGAALAAPPYIPPVAP